MGFESLDIESICRIYGPCGAAIFKEVDEPLQLDKLESSLDDEFIQRNVDDAHETYIHVRYDVMELPISLPSQKPLVDKRHPKQGIGLISCSSNSQFICTRNDSMPTVLWIWDVQLLELASLLIQKDPIRAVAWDPTFPRLVFCTGSTQIYTWTPSGAYCINVPFPEFSGLDLKWNSDGGCILLKYKASFCCAALPVLQESSDYSSDD